MNTSRNPGKSGINSWIDTFLSDHLIRFQRTDWPRFGTAEYKEFSADWVVVMQSLRVTRDEAVEASKMLVSAPPRFSDGHVPALLAAVKTIRASRGVTDPDMTLEGARAASRDCPYCYAEGMVTVFKQDDSRGPLHVSASCTCKIGRLMRRMNLQKDAKLAQRIPDLADILAGNERRWGLDEPQGPTAPSSPINTGSNLERAAERLIDQYTPDLRVAIYPNESVDEIKQNVGDMLHRPASDPFGAWARRTLKAMAKTTLTDHRSLELRIWALAKLNVGTENVAQSEPTPEPGPPPPLRQRFPGRPDDARIKDDAILRNEFDY